MATFCGLFGGPTTGLKREFALIYSICMQALCLETIVAKRYNVRSYPILALKLAMHRF
jgi:hypothetical protein